MPATRYVGHFYLSPLEYRLARRLCRRRRSSLSGLVHRALFDTLLSEQLLPPDTPAPRFSHRPPALRLSEDRHKRP